MNGSTVLRVRAVTPAGEQPTLRNLRAAIPGSSAGSAATASGPASLRAVERTVNARRRRTLDAETLTLVSALLAATGQGRPGTRMLGQLATRVAHALGATILSVRLLDASKRWLHLKASYGLSKRLRTRLRRIPVDSPIGREVVARGRRFVLSGHTPKLEPWPLGLVRRFGAGAFVPIRSGATVLGVLGVGFRDPAPPQASQVDFLDLLGRQLGAVLHVLRGRETRLKARSEAHFLRRITAALGANLEVRAVIDMVTLAAARLTRARGAVVLLCSKDGSEFEVASTSKYERRFDLIGMRFPAKGSLSELVAQTGRAVRSRDARVDPRPMIRTLQQTVNVRGLLIVPLRGAYGTIGTLAVSSGRPRLFSEHDRRILIQLGDQASLAIQNARLFEAARGHRQLLRQLYSRQSSVLEGERQRIAHELHDEMGPTLSAILINLQLFKEQLGGDVALSNKVAETEEHLTGMIQKIRELAYGLRPPMLEHMGLAESLKWMIETYFCGGRLVVDYAYSGPHVGLDPELALAIYRTAQEALTNVVKHARAERVRMRLRITPSLVTLAVRDDGCGFDVEQVRPDRKAGLGLASMRERMEHLHGRVEIRSAPGKGTWLTVACPIEVRHASAVG
jgi:signal transduction histidine kinase